MIFKRPGRMVAGYVGAEIAYPFTCETRTGAKIVISDRWDLETVWVIFLRREYRVEANDRMIVDCGANIGVFAIYAAMKAGQAEILAVEPFPETFEKLQTNLRLNGLEKRVKTGSYALAESDGRANMDNWSTRPSQSHQVLPEPAESMVGVATISLASLAERTGNGVVDLLKMDIEGSEHRALLSSQPSVLRKFRRISMEYHQNAPKEPLFAKLTGAGFRVRNDRILGKNYGVAEFVQEGW
jgi:FkbM family methyltransferase